MKGNLPCDCYDGQEDLETPSSSLKHDREKQSWWKYRATFESSFNAKSHSKEFPVKVSEQSHQFVQKGFRYLDKELNEQTTLTKRERKKLKRLKN